MSGWKVIWVSLDSGQAGEHEPDNKVRLQTVTHPAGLVPLTLPRQDPPDDLFLEIAFSLLIRFTILFKWNPTNYLSTCIPANTKHCYANVLCLLGCLQ